MVIDLSGYLQERINELRRMAYDSRPIPESYEIQGAIRQVIQIAKDFDIDIDTNVDVLTGWKRD